jgi:hypothetical protein
MGAAKTTAWVPLTPVIGPGVRKCLQWVESRRCGPVEMLNFDVQKFYACRIADGETDAQCTRRPQGNGLRATYLLLVGTAAAACMPPAFAALVIWVGIRRHRGTGERSPSCNFQSNRGSVQKAWCSAFTSAGD